jgi:hypothetical protein
LNELFVADFLFSGVSEQLLIEDEHSFFVEFFEIFEAVIVLFHVGELLETELHSFEQLNAAACEQFLYFALISEDHCYVLAFVDFPNQPSS